MTQDANMSNSVNFTPPRPAWYFHSTRDGDIKAVEPSGRRHIVAQRSGFHSNAGNALFTAMTRDLIAMPHVTAERDQLRNLSENQRKVLDTITAEMALAGVACGTMHSQIPDLLRPVLERRIVAYGIFAMIPDEGWVLQFPNYRERVDAERAAGTFTVGHVEVRPLYG